MEEKEEYEIALIENIHRHTLNPMGEAIAIERYLDNISWSGITELVKCIRKSQEFVSRRISLL